MAVEANKGNTLKVRMDASTLDLMERARGYLKLDKSKFIKQSVRQLAETTLEEYETTRFNADDWQMFFNLLENPPKPASRMKRAAKTYKTILSRHEI